MEQKIGYIRHFVLFKTKQRTRESDKILRKYMCVQKRSSMRWSTQNPVKKNFVSGKSVGVSVVLTVAEASEPYRVCPSSSKQPRLRSGYDGLQGRAPWGTPPVNALPNPGTRSDRAFNSQNLFFFKTVARKKSPSFYFTLPVIVGLGPLRGTNKHSKRPTRQIRWILSRPFFPNLTRLRMFISQEFQCTPGTLIHRDSNRRWPVVVRIDGQTDPRQRHHVCDL